MGKRIISQARGKGSLRYRVRRKAFSFKVKYPSEQGEAEIIDIIHTPSHSAPLLKLRLNNNVFYNPAFNKATTGEKIKVDSTEVKEGNILRIKNMPLGTKVYNIERRPNDGGKMMHSAGCSAIVSKQHGNNIFSILMPNKKEVLLSGDCRATIGIIAGAGKKQKPFVTAGRKFYKMRARGGKLWPRTSAVKMNAVDHPFGSGRGKRIKSKIAKRNAPPGRRVGHISPRRTGRKK